MKINGLDAIGEETEFRGYVGEPAKLQQVSEVGPEFSKLWWRDIHSGSKAIEAAREILKCPAVLGTGERSAELPLICAELIFRVTGEQITPEGFAWYGRTLVGEGFEFEFSDSKHDAETP